MRSNNSSRVWAQLLWDYFTQFVQNGSQFYLSIDSETLFQLARIEWPDLVDASDSLQRFCDACAELLILHPSWVELKAETFEPSADGFSRCICLAAQQVLVVERMFRNESYSENAYFPRYRELLGLEDTLRKLNPLGSDQFFRIWDTLKAEALSIPGASSETITFQRGTGINLTRQLPISQALFTAHDLSRLRAKLSDTVNTDDQSALFRFFDEHRSVLAARAKNLLTINDPGFKSRLCAQFRNSLKSTPASLQVERTVRLGRENYTVIAYPDTTEIIEEKFNLYLRSDKGTRNASSTEDDSAVLRNLCSKQGYLVFVEEDDHFGQSSEPIELRGGDQILVLYSLKNVELLESIFKSFGPRNFAESGSIVSGNIPEGLALRYIDSLIEPQFKLIAQNGLLEVGEGVEASSLELLGGYVLNKRKRQYLCGYPPEGLGFAGTKLPDEELLQVEGRTLTAKDFFESLKRVLEFSRFSVTYQGKRTEFTIDQIQSDKRLLREPLGYPIRAGRLSAVPTSISQEEAFLSGVFLQHESTHLETGRSPDLGRIVHLLHPGIQCARIAVSEKEIEDLIPLVSSSLPDQVAQLVNKYIRESKLIPVVFKTLLRDRKLVA